MPWLSFKIVAPADDTAITLAAGLLSSGAAVGATPFSHGYVSLEPGASGEARIGDGTIAIATKIGARIDPAATVPIYPSGGPCPHNTATTYVRFFGHTAGDVIGATLWVN
jgi:hypothetical protein